MEHFHDAPKHEIEWIGGQCPVQAEGRVEDHFFYFRARGDVLQMSVHRREPLWEDAWFFYQPYKEHPQAGYIDHKLARLWIRPSGLETGTGVKHVRMD